VGMGVGRASSANVSSCLTGHGALEIDVVLVVIRALVLVLLRTRRARVGVNVIVRIEGFSVSLVGPYTCLALSRSHSSNRISHSVITRWSRGLHKVDILGTRSAGDGLTVILVSHS